MRGQAKNINSKTSATRDPSSRQIGKACHHYARVVACTPNQGKFGGLPPLIHVACSYARFGQQGPARS